MIISQSSLSMDSHRTAEVKHEVKSELTLWRGERSGADSEQTRTPGRSLVVRAEALQVTISQTAHSLQPKEALLKLDDAAPEPHMGELKIQLIKIMIEHFTGREIDILTTDELQPEAQPVETEPTHPKLELQAPAQSAGWGMIYDFYESHYESEHVDFKAQGKVLTADGREISIALQLSMSREFLRESTVQIRAGDAVMKDPLVVNFNGTAAQLTERNFHFDIDADGRDEQIAFVRPGSGLLALDRNADGRINDGSELFGALSGDGFSELANHDKDGNGWIDEADSIYRRLRIWTKSADGQDSLMALGQTGVGAIYLGSVETPFLLKDAGNETLGQIRQTGIYLSEDGETGTLQQLDLVV
ncbi:MAG: hypothetical protein N0E54_10820 [Candidatus Thiodiazotropha taylori]|nr:hypothetical protein [Candidatus Thiodiazotropha endolucinida]MCW4229221.1 hypothetical protein [Candidatus Thiodiazotropha taylori]